MNTYAMDLIKQYEGIRLTAYECPGHVLTIGYGHTEGVYTGQSLTYQEAERLLADDVEYYKAQVTKLLKVSVTEKQLGALISFAYDVGVWAFEQSSLLRKLNAGDFQGACREFHKWKYADGVILPGLETRRKAEAELFSVG